MSSLPLMQLANDLPHFILVGIDYISSNLNDFKMVTNVKSLSETLKKRNYEGLTLNTVILEDETHCSAIAATLNRGLRSVFS